MASPNPHIMDNVRRCLEYATQNGQLILDRCDEDIIDGRIGSVYMKKRVIDFLKDNGFEIRDSRTCRDWYSMIVVDPQEGIEIPCNITISNGGADNFHNKSAIVYSCTNLGIEEIPKMMSYDDMYNLVKDNIGSSRDRKKEYYMIFLNKRKAKVVVRSLCDIMYFRSNPSNHLQIEWNKEIKHRGQVSILCDSPLDVFERIREVLAESFTNMNERMKIVTTPMERV